MFASLLVTVLACTSALAVPTSYQTTLCNVSTRTFSMPSTQTSSTTPLAAPISAGPTFIGLGVGVQNYTCSTAGTYTSVGAVAQLVDISCLPASSYSGLTNTTSSSWQAAPQSLTATQFTSTLLSPRPSFILGQHYFIPSPSGTGLSPKWDFTSASFAGNSSAYVVGGKTGDDVAPSSQGVDWLSLNGIEGLLATQIYRIETRGGQPPASCTPGSDPISVRYVSQYWFLGGSF